MKPDEVVDILKNDWGLITTRRTVLTYEKEGLIAPPFIETGKYKEYPSTAVAEFIASWCLIHGDYGLRLKKVSEIRKKALQIIYSFKDIWYEELARPQDIKDLHELVKTGKSWQKPCDFFIFTWIVIRMALTYSNQEDIKDSVKKFIHSGNFDDIPKIDIVTDFKISSSQSCHQDVKISSIFVKGRGSIKINLSDIDNEYKNDEEVVKAMDLGTYNFNKYKSIKIIYIHPEDFAINKPIID